MTWKKILNLLVSHNTFVSGEQIGRSLNISRTAIWKHINFLKQYGYIIQSSSNAGYKLQFPTDTPIVLEPEELTTGIAGRKIISTITTTSTNNNAISIAENVTEGTVVITESQTEGRGRRGRNWVSPFGMGLYFSIILKPVLPVAKLPRMTILIGVAIANALKKFNIFPQLKWPNDIILNEKKIGGVLSELFVEGDIAKYVVVGVGLNVHTRSDDFPEEIRKIAGSIFTETGKSFSRLKILTACLSEIDNAYKFFVKNSGDLGEFAHSWNEIAWKKGEEVLITTGKEKELCKIIGLREDGVLLVEQGKKLKEVFVGEILF